MKYEGRGAQGNLFDYLDRMAGKGLPPSALDRLDSVVYWEDFREPIEQILQLRGGTEKGGRPPKDTVLMWKICVLQNYYGLSDEQTEIQIADRLSFQRFLGLGPSDKVPDRNTIWTFKERLSDKGVRLLFEDLNEHLKNNGLLPKTGKMIDATFVEAPRQRNKREENEQIKEGKRPENFDENPHRGAQKDTDARWTKKNDEVHFGYKNHTKVNAATKMVEDYCVSAACVHDSQALPELTKPEDPSLYADSAYAGEPIAKDLESKRIVNCVHEKGTRGHPLSEGQKELNRLRSKVRARIEHVYGWMTQHGDLKVRSIGLKRAARFIGLRNIVYNLFRMEYYMRNKAIA